MDDSYSAVERLWRPRMTAVKMPHVNVDRHFVALRGITLYNVKFWAFPEFIITPSLVIKLSTTTAPDFIGLVSVWDLNDDDERRRVPVNSSHGQLVTQSPRHTVNSSQSIRHHDLTVTITTTIQLQLQFKELYTL